MRSPLAVPDVVALLRDVPEHGLVRGQVGTVVEELGNDTVEVEFSDGEGRAFAMLALLRSDLLALRYHPSEAA